MKASNKNAGLRYNININTLHIFFYMFAIQKIKKFPLRRYNTFKEFRKKSNCIKNLGKTWPYEWVSWPYHLTLSGADLIHWQNTLHDLHEWITLQFTEKFIYNYVKFIYNKIYGWCVIFFLSCLFSNHFGCTFLCLLIFSTTRPQSCHARTMAEIDYNDKRIIYLFIYNVRKISFHPIDLEINYSLCPKLVPTFEYLYTDYWYCWYYIFVWSVFRVLCLNQQRLLTSVPS